ncbi:MAG: class I mannose-6-phosphate isomerase [Clostridia bacterium]|nr:class I mannose-6-phosphate isomerase [Clostridia bacterium]
MLYPMLMKPGFKEVTWGGAKLRTLYNKEIISDKTGESWEISCRTDLPSIIVNGEFAGQSFYDVYMKYSKEISGRENFEFPWLVKFLDAKEYLSVQVHPDDCYAISNGDGMGKTEMWYVVQCEEDSRLIAGFNRDMDKELMVKTACDGTIADYLNSEKVKAGDVFFIPPGTVHAIGAGIFILEIQQNSDATYRLFDWNRVDANGNSRELHVKKASDVSLLEKSQGLTKPLLLENGDLLLSECSYFKTVKRTVKEKSVIEKGMTALIVISGEGILGDLTLKPGDSVLIPYSAGNIELAGSLECVLVTLP